MAHLLGLPSDDWQRLFAWSESAMELIGGLAEPASFARLYGDIEALQVYLGEAIDLDQPRRSAEPVERASDDGGVIRLVSDALAAGTLEMWEASGLLFQLVVAGSDTTVGLIGAAIRRLAEEPARAGRLRADRASIGPFIEETMRLDGPAIGNYRRAKCDSEVGGVRIPEGATLTLLWGSPPIGTRASSQIRTSSIRAGPT